MSTAWKDCKSCEQTDLQHWAGWAVRPDIAGEFFPGSPVHDHAFVLAGVKILAIERRNSIRRMLEISRIREACGAYRNPKNWGKIQRWRKALVAELRNVNDWIATHCIEGVTP